MEYNLNSKDFGLKIYNKFPASYKEDDFKVNLALKRYMQSIGDGGFKHVIDDINKMTSLVNPNTCSMDILKALFNQYGFTDIYNVPEDYLRFLLPMLSTAWGKKGSISVVESIISIISGIDARTDIEYRADGSIHVTIRLEMDFELSDYFPDTKQFHRIAKSFLPFYTDNSMLYSYVYYENQTVHLVEEYPYLTVIRENVLETPSLACTESGYKGFISQSVNEAAGITCAIRDLLSFPPIHEEKEISVTDVLGSTIIRGMHYESPHIPITEKFSDYIRSTVFQDSCVIALSESIIDGTSLMDSDLVSLRVSEFNEDSFLSAGSTYDESLNLRPTESFGSRIKSVVSTETTGMFSSPSSIDKEENISYEEGVLNSTLVLNGDFSNPGFKKISYLSPWSSCNHSFVNHVCGKCDVPEVGIIPSATSIFDGDLENTKLRMLVMYEFINEDLKDEILKYGMLFNSGSSADPFTELVLGGTRVSERYGNLASIPAGYYYTLGLSKETHFIRTIPFRGIITLKDGTTLYGPQYHARFYDLLPIVLNTFSNSSGKLTTTLFFIFVEVNATIMEAGFHIHGFILLADKVNTEYSEDDFNSMLITNDKFQQVTKVADSDSRFRYFIRSDCADVIYHFRPCVEYYTDDDSTHRYLYGEVFTTSYSKVVNGS